MANTQEMKFEINGHYLKIEYKNISKDIEKKLLNLFNEEMNESLKNIPIVENIEDSHDIKENHKEDTQCDDVDKVVVDWNKFTDIYGQEFKPNTLKTYKNYAKKIVDQFKGLDIHTIITTKTQELLNYIEEMNVSEETKKQYYKVIICVCRNIDIDDILDKFKNKLKILHDKLNDAQNTKTPMEQKKTNALIEKLQNCRDKLDISISMNEKKRYEIRYRQFLLLKFILDYGSLRTAEFQSIYIMDNDDHGHKNYFNVDKKQLIIKDHKNDSSIGPRCINIKDDFIDLIIDHVRKPFLGTLDNTKTYNSDTSFRGTYFTKELGLKPVELRHIKVCDAINLEYEQKIENLSNIQGHSKSTMMKYYTKNI